MPSGDHWFVLGRRIGEQNTSGLDLFAHDQRCQGLGCTRTHREPCKVGNLLAVAHASPNIELTSHSIPSQKWNYQQIVEQTLKVVRIQQRRCSWSVELYLCDSNRPVPSLANVNPTGFLWAVGANQACNGGGWEKSGQEKSKMTPAKVALHNVKNKPWKLEQTKKRVIALRARWCVGVNIDFVNVQSFFFCHFQSCCALPSFLFKNRLFTAKEVFLFTERCGWSANVTRLHWPSS